MPHIHEKIDFCAEVYVVNEDKVLLRMHEKYNTWLPPGGHVELDEGPEEAAVREVMEEAGIAVTLLGERAPNYSDNDQELLVPRFLNRHPTSATHEHIAFVYFGTSETRELAPHPSEKNVEMRWFSVEELDEEHYAIWERVRQYAKAALAAAKK